MALLTLISILCLSLGIESRRLDCQREAVAVIDRLHGTIGFSSEPHLPARMASALGGPSLTDQVRRSLGDEPFRSIEHVSVSFNPYVIDADPAQRANDEDVRVICEARSVRLLSLTGTAVTDDGLRHLRTLTRLETLRLCNLVTRDNLIGAGIISRRLGIENSTDVWIAGREYGARAVFVGPLNEYWLKMPQEQGFGESPRPLGEGMPMAVTTRESMWRLTGPLITDRGLRHLSHLRCLRELWLDGTAVTDAGVKKWLPHLTNLERLSLAQTQISDDCLESVCAMPKLVVLDLTGTKITRAGLPRTGRLGSAATVYLGDTGVTQEAADQFVLARSRTGSGAPKIVLRSRYLDDLDDLKRRARKGLAPQRASGATTNESRLRTDE